jgi:UDP-N-acetylmuramate--alanine ligase
MLLDDFAASFADANRVIVTDIYAAREAPVPGVTGQALVQRILEVEPDKQVEHLSDRAAIVRKLIAESRTGDLVIAMGAGDIRQVGEALVAELERRCTDNLGEQDEEPADRVSGREHE